ncbi:aspartate kinase [Alicyclobacillus acidoterrestris]|uniref:Aspartokinase n=1 Tax=Alicyclobacillus acidoterrestris (strain ATCC 49025 / DSM 3922 / CIP 106132 / NCIMB 13137 / GD3B) TaxID=1356854 RepID=T0BLM6_ALIAG|nr:aspartate kinase [Alicyclobacillus acidoterrestris]EPZ41629.1 aspartate kinase [Alicyclobacillus acidoterrestris ATCC 49025]UNO50540.1 aspartate kinase [Alicyclobacillus acidoterrestris]
MLVVQKYGGTSVGSTERIRLVAQRIQNTIARGHQCVVVVSAMGHSTDALVDLAKEIADVPDAREMDSLLATGEQVSASLLAMRLVHMGTPAQSLTGWQAGIATEDVHGNARVTSIETARLRQLIDSGITPIVTGFQGIANGNITTLGRGGSDTSAVALAAALHADICEIYTDVDGVYTTDPRVVQAARKLTEVSYDEMLELANLGAQVLHPRAVENAKHFAVPLVVRSSFSDEEGTSVVAITEQTLEGRQVVTGIAFERQVARIAVIGVPLQQHGLATIFSELASHGVNVDVIVQSVVDAAAVDVSFTVHEPDLTKAVGIVESLQESLHFTRVERQSDLAKVSIVGAGMISNPGVAARMFVTLRDANIAVHMVSTSEIKVSCVVPADDVERAVKALHVTFVEADAEASLSEAGSAVK